MRAPDTHIIVRKTPGALVGAEGHISIAGAATASPPAAVIRASLVNGLLVEGGVRATAFAGRVVVGDGSPVNLVHPNLHIGVVLCIGNRTVELGPVRSNNGSCCGKDKGQDQNFDFQPDNCCARVLTLGKRGSAGKAGWRGAGLVGGGKWRGADGGGILGATSDVTDGLGLYQARHLVMVVEAFERIRQVHTSTSVKEAGRSSLDSWRLASSARSSEP